ncbi:hypothetical protein P1J78_25205, partial [Psychromarinibacter sp. C21-152]
PDWARSRPAPARQAPDSSAPGLQALTAPSGHSLISSTLRRGFTEPAIRTGLQHIPVAEGR